MESIPSDGSHRSLMKPHAITVDGDRVVYRAADKGRMLLHGMAGNALTWRHVMPALAKRFTVLAPPDLLGQGLSKKPHGEYFPCVLSELRLRQGDDARSTSWAHEPFVSMLATKSR